MKSPTGRYTRIRARDPRALAVCDYSGMYCMHSDLVRQMEYRGSGLVWTGFMVNKKFADKPNHQMLTPILMPDPIPVVMPRPDTATLSINYPTASPFNDYEPDAKGVYPQNPAPPSGREADPAIPGGGQPYPPKGVYKKTKFY